MRSVIVLTDNREGQSAEKNTAVQMGDKSHIEFRSSAFKGIFHSIG